MSLEIHVPCRHRKTHSCVVGHFFAASDGERFECDKTIVQRSVLIKNMIEGEP